MLKSCHFIVDVKLFNSVIIMKRVLQRLFYLIHDNRASPLVEEGLLIGLAIVLFLVIVGIVGNIVDWINSLASELP